MDAPALPPVLPPPLPRKKRRWKVVLCFIIAFFIAAVTASIIKKSPLAGHREELRAIEALSALRYPEQTDKAKHACTEKGYRLVEVFGGFKPASFNAVSVKSNPQFSDVEMFRDSAEGRTRIHVRLVKDNGWKFDDVYLNELDSKPCNQWVSYVCEHPIAFAFEFLLYVVELTGIHHSRRLSVALCSSRRSPAAPVAADCGREFAPRQMVILTDQRRCKAKFELGR